MTFYFEMIEQSRDEENRGKMELGKLNPIYYTVVTLTTVFSIVYHITKQ